MTDVKITSSRRKIFEMNNIMRHRGREGEQLFDDSPSLALFPRELRTPPAWQVGYQFPHLFCSQLRGDGARRALAQRGQDSAGPAAGEYDAQFNLRPSSKHEWMQTWAMGMCGNETIETYTIETIE